MEVMASYNIGDRDDFLWSGIHSEYIVSAGGELLFLHPHCTFCLGRIKDSSLYCFRMGCPADLNLSLAHHISSCPFPKRSVYL